MITLQQIKQGEQSPYWGKDSPRERKASLLNHFNFDCDCTACKNEWVAHSINSFPSRMIDLPLPIKKKLDYLQDKSYLGESLTSTNVIIKYLQRISLSMELMNLHQEDMEYPTKEMMELKLATMILYENCTL
ncbi:hypothetical protein PV325_010992 [Microctonus aethiopoides]|nr:hypothetical protein PV325_010992 [Microctonus aethiopoides]